MTKEKKEKNESERGQCWKGNILKMSVMNRNKSKKAILKRTNLNKDKDEKGN